MMEKSNKLKITRPTLLLNEAIVKANIGRMVDKAKAQEVALVPHFKTHQSKLVGQWFREAGVKAITVASVAMAEYFAADGWTNITIAFPVNVLEVDAISRLTEKVNLTVLVTGIEQVKQLQAHVELSMNMLIEIDCGYNRSGVSYKDDKQVYAIADALTGTQHHFAGFYSHFGDTYHAHNPQEVLEIYHRSLHRLTDLQLRCADLNPTISIGDTPSCSLAPDFKGVKSIHPGNFVFYDLTQAQIGACREEDIAVALACPVVSKNEERQEVVVHGGGVHLSKEGLYDHMLEQTIYGKVVHLQDDGWTASLAGCYLRSISQEHGIVKLSKEAYTAINVGDVIGVLPVHSCMTADVMGGYRLQNGTHADHLKFLR